jgi:hypothetical protein
MTNLNVLIIKDLQNWSAYECVGASTRRVKPDAPD